MPRTIKPHRPLAGIHPAINCNFCANMDKGAAIMDSDLLFDTSCPKFVMAGNYFHCQRHGQRLHWIVCAWRHHNDILPVCGDCRIGEGMMDVALATGHRIPEEEN